MEFHLTPLRVACAVGFVACAVIVAFVQGTGESTRGTTTESSRQIEHEPASPSDTIETPHRVGERATAAAADPEVGEEDPDWSTAPIEEIKQALYEREIESVEELHLLDEFVNIGDADTRDFWNTDWAGVDDWKREEDGFSLEKLDDGTLVFVPGEETRRTYTFFETMNIYDYDEQTQEFVHETDYYGKPIVNVVKFLREDVMVMLVVSGTKVDMNIYELNETRRD